MKSVEIFSYQFPPAIAGGILFQSVMQLVQPSKNFYLSQVSAT